MRMTSANREPRRYFLLLAILAAACGNYLMCPAVGLTQDVTSVEGLGEGERDTMRVDSRVEGREDRIEDSRISDQKIGYEERKVRLEKRAEELLRDEEVSREREERFAKEEEDARARARRRDEEDVQRKKRAVDVSPDL